MHVVLFAQSITPITVDVEPLVLFENTSVEAGTTVGNLTATPSGGMGSYTYAWTSGDLVNLAINSPGNSSTTFNYIDLFSLGDEATGTITCTVTDSLGNTGYANRSVGVIRIS